VWVLRPGGRGAFIASGSQVPTPPRGDVQALRPNVVRDRPHLERLVALLEESAMLVPEVTRFPLSEAAAAHRVSEARHFRGKLVLVVR
jgi:NADPH:quinone reductase-like Zn-dependent oxidoreductase